MNEAEWQTRKQRIPEVIENIWQNVDRDYHVRILAKRLLRIDKDMNGKAHAPSSRRGLSQTRPRH